MRGEPSRLLALVTKSSDDLLHRYAQGFLVTAEGQFAKEAEACGWSDLEDMGVPAARLDGTDEEATGLLVFEGWVEWVGGGSYPEGHDPAEPEWEGWWRRVTHWEMCRVRVGLPPWETKGAADGQ